MPDISMCVGGDCPKKAECYRYRAVPNEPWQTFTAFPQGGSCTQGLEILPGDRVRSLSEIEVARGKSGLP